ncbi:MAG: SDR family NAD(P)-dependent oxidoreductase [Propionibacteriaceae bacterium]|nr:SDR family NAD(P)-dependent oxidoreductase [Propionibacteriaceae bacterium]
MARIFITGSSDGLGRAAAEQLMADGHQLVLHARNSERAEAVADLVARGAVVLTGDLGDLGEIRRLAEAANELGRFDSVIHNAGLGDGSSGPVLTVNVVAPYLLTALMERPGRLIYLSSGMHRDGDEAIVGADWGAAGGDYSSSKLAVAALAMAVARLWHEAASNAVDPGWVPTKMGGAGAPESFDNGISTQVWLAGADEAAAESGGYWKKLERQAPHPAVVDEVFQETLLAALAEHTGVALPR